MHQERALMLVSIEGKYETTKNQQKDAEQAKRFRRRELS